jgi:SSS family transporter
MSTTFSPIDVSVLVIYIAASVGLGLYHARKRQGSLEDYFLAARSVPWWAAGISIIASDTSAISYMGAPAYVFRKDMQMAPGQLVFPLVMILVACIFVPLLARLRLYTVYEYLEGRFGILARSLASLLFQLLRGGHLAVAIFAQGKALTLITGLQTYEAVAICGAVVTLYTVLGGMKAVIWTDVLQFFVTTGGIFAVLIAVLWTFHGDTSTIWRICAVTGHDHTRLATFDLDPTKEVTIWALMLGNFVMIFSTYSTDQVIVQRYLATGSRRDMTRAVLLNGFLSMLPMLALYLTGLGLVAYYANNPDLRADLKDPDRVLPHFILHVLPVGVAGLVIAGMLAATMSSVSSGLNSLSTATVVDFWQRFRQVPGSEREDVWMAKFVTLGWGVLVTLPALRFLDQYEGVVEICLTVIGFFSGPLLAMFLLGVLTRRTNSVGVLLGAGLGTAAVSCFFIAQVWHQSYADSLPLGRLAAAASALGRVSYLWYGPIGCATTMAAGWLLSFLFPPPPSAAVGPLTVWADS